MNPKAITLNDFETTIIEDILTNILKGKKNKKEFKKGFFVTGIYFAGNNIMIDIKRNYLGKVFTDILVLKYTIGYFSLFSGGFDSLMSIKAINLCEEIVKEK
jgi:hypothetical protein